MTDWKEAWDNFKQLESMGLIKIKNSKMMKVIFKGSCDAPKPVKEESTPKVIYPDNNYQVNENADNIRWNSVLIVALILSQILLWVIFIYG